VRIEIERVDPGERPEVTFRSAGGRARGRWRGDRSPLPGEEDVELAIDGVYRWDGDVAPAPPEVPSGVREADGGILVAGRCVALEDEILVLDVGGGLAYVEVAGEPPAGLDGRRFAVRVPGIELYPTGV
jgi:hypothetical protein